MLGCHGYTSQTGVPISTSIMSPDHCLPPTDVALEKKRSGVSVVCVCVGGGQSIFPLFLMVKYDVTSNCFRNFSSYKLLTIRLHVWKYNHAPPALYELRAYTCMSLGPIPVWTILYSLELIGEFIQFNFSLIRPIRSMCCCIDSYNLSYWLCYCVVIAIIGDLTKFEGFPIWKITYKCAHIHAYRPTYMRIIYRPSPT